MKKALIVDDLIFQMIATKMIQKAGLDGSPKTFCQWQSGFGVPAE